MRLRTQAALTVLATVAAATAGLAFFVERAASAAFREVEAAQVRRDVDRAALALRGRLRALRNQVHDYAEWSDTHEFLSGKRPDYLGTGLTTATMAGPGLDIVFLADTAGRVVLARGYDPEEEAFTDPPEWLAALPADSPVLAPAKGAAPEVTAAWASPGGPALVSVLPVTLSDGSGPSAGAFGFLRFLSEAEVGRIAAETRLGLTVSPLAAVAPGPLRDAVAALPIPAAPDAAAETAGPAEAVVVPRDDAVIEGATLVPLLGSRDPLVVAVRGDRPVLAEARAVIRTANAGIVLTGLLLVLVVLLAAEWFLAAPLTRLRDAVLHIARSGRTDGAVEAQGVKEIRDLTRSFNAMLSRLDETRGELSRALAEARGTSQAKSAFLANMSHEIRTPMAGVLGMLDLSLMTGLTADQRALLTTARGSAASLLAILNDVLDLSKVEAGRLELESLPFDLPAHLREVAQPFAFLARERSLEFRLELDASLPQGVRGDALRLRQVLSNLLSNAIKFTPRGRVILHARPDGPGTAEEARVRFEVEDTGIGIPADRKDRIFSAFQQADSSTTRRFGGTGLGVHIAARLVSLMGGRLEVESDPGLGTRFFFTAVFPRAEAPAPPPAEGPAGAATPGARRLRVLVAEDNAVNQLIATKFLERLGHSAFVVDEGAKAVKAAAAGGFDLVLMDVHMPVMDGLEATRAIRVAEKPGGTRVPIVALTAGAMKGDHEACMAAGMDAILTKPYTLSELSAALREPFAVTA